MIRTRLQGDTPFFPNMLNNGNIEVCLKEDVDKAIAELEDKLRAANEQIENLINSASSIMLFQHRVNDNKCDELRHHKYKRCLAMALLWLERTENSTDLENELVSRRRCSKWMELAEKFKEAK